MFSAKKPRFSKENLKNWGQNVAGLPYIEKRKGDAFASPGFCLAAAAVIVAATAAAVVRAHQAVVATAAEQDEQDDDPAAVTAPTIVTHKKIPPSQISSGVFTTHSMVFSRAENESCPFYKVRSASARAVLPAVFSPYHFSASPQGRI